MWEPSTDQVGLLLDKLSRTPSDEEQTRTNLIDAVKLNGFALDRLLLHLEHQHKDVRQAVIEALGQLGDKQAVAPLLAKLDDQNPANRASVAAALHALGQPEGTVVLKIYLTSEVAELRQTAVRSLARGRGELDQRLLSRDLDAANPWLDPREPITDAQVTNASSILNLTRDQVRSRYEVLAVDLDLQLSWKI